MTPRKARKIAAANWTLALIEGRVIKIDDLTMKSYPTIEATQTALQALLADGVNAKIIRYGVKV